MGKALELIGQRFGRLVVETQSNVRTLNGNIRWNCICDCGNKTTVTGAHLVSKNIQSCGCLHKETVGAMSVNVNTTHGMSYSSEYRTWRAMINRCTNSNDQAYDDYGGRGITICDRWLNSFEAFYEDMGLRPSSDHTLDRREVNGNYDKSNCRWATPTEQANNKRNNVFYTHSGVTKTISEWSREYRIDYGKLYKRLIRDKWDFDRAVSIP